jgi:hypothetical protein
LALKVGSWDSTIIFTAIPAPRRPSRATRRDRELIQGKEHEANDDRCDGGDVSTIDALQSVVAHSEEAGDDLLERRAHRRHPDMPFWREWRVEGLAIRSFSFGSASGSALEMAKTTV